MSGAGSGPFAKPGGTVGEAGENARRALLAPGSVVLIVVAAVVGVSAGRASRP